MSSTEPNFAATLTEPKANPYTVTTQPTPEPRAGEILVRVHAVAINPADAIVQEQGILFPPESYPIVPGSDLAGVVVSAPADSGFRAGDRVTACVESGAFATFAITQPGTTARLPDAVTFAQACVLPLGFCTALGGLFVPGSMELSPPGETQGGKGAVVLVAAGASSVGSCAVQLLAAAGYRVAATASAANQTYLRSIGAEWAFDYKRAGVEEEVLEALKGLAFAGIYSATGDVATLEMLARIAGALGKDEKSRVVGTIMPPFLKYEGAKPEGVKMGHSMAGAVMAVSELGKLFGRKPDEQALQLGSKTWKWLSSALETGAFQCKPDPQVVGSGVGEIQKGVDAWKAGVSARKIVVEIP